MQRDIAYLKSRFENGDKPSEQDFIDLIDSILHYSRIKQTEGESQTDLMSQEAVTIALEGIREIIQNLTLDNIADGNEFKRLTGTERQLIALIKTDQGANKFLSGDGQYREVQTESSGHPHARFRTFENLTERNQWTGLIDGDAALVWDASADPLIESGLGVYFWNAAQGTWRLLVGSGGGAATGINAVDTFEDLGNIQGQSDGYPVIVWDASGDPDLDGGSFLYAWKSDPGEWRRIGGTGGGIIVDPTKLSDPELVLISGNEQIGVEIRNIDENAIGVELYRATIADFSDEVQVPVSFSAGMISLIDSGLTNGVRYFYRVRVTGGENYDPSNFVINSRVPVNVNQLAAPFIFLLGGNEEIEVFVMGIEIRAKDVILMRATQPDYSDEVQVPATITGEQSILTDDNGGAGLTNGTTYYYRVKLQADDYDESVWVEASEAPTNLPRLEAPILRLRGGSSFAQIEISNIDEDAEDVVLTRSLDSDFSDEQEVPVLFNPNGIILSDTNTTAGLTYYYRVKAVANGFADSVYATSRIKVVAGASTFDVHPAGSGGAYLPNGLIEYRPRNFNPAQKYPVVICKHGFGEPGDGSTFQLQFLVTNGVAKWLYRTPDEMDEIVGNFVVVVPQNFAGAWNAGVLLTIVNAVRRLPYVDPARICTNGFSSGGWAALTCITNNTINPYIAAAVPISGGPLTEHENNVANGLEIPTWMFHNNDDVPPNTIGDVKNWIEARRALGGDQTWLTNYVGGVGHDAWNRTYNNQGMTDPLVLNEPYEIEFKESMFDFLAKYAVLLRPYIISALPDGENAIDVVWRDDNETTQESGFFLEHRTKGSGSWTVIPIGAGQTQHKIPIPPAAGSIQEIRIKAVGNGSTIRDSRYSYVIQGHTEGIDEATKTVQVHFDRFDNDTVIPDNYWNGCRIHSIPDNTILRNDLIAMDGSQSGWILVAEKGCWNAATESAVQAGSPFPNDIVLHRALQNTFTDQSTNNSMYVGNLNPAKKYRLKFFGYINSNEPYMTEFECQGVKQVLDCNDNLDKVRTFNDVSPDGNGRIYFKFGKAEGNTLAFAVANAVIIEEL